MAFSKEADFEQALIDLLKTKGWEDRVLKNYSEAELIRNWADIWILQKPLLKRAL